MDPKFWGPHRRQARCKVSFCSPDSARRRFKKHLAPAAGRARGLHSLRKSASGETAEPPPRALPAIGVFGDRPFPQWPRKGGESNLSAPWRLLRLCLRAFSLSLLSTVAAKWFLGPHGPRALQPPRGLRGPPSLSAKPPVTTSAIGPDNRYCTL